MTEPLSPEEEAVLRRGAWATSAWPEVMPRIWATLDAARARLKFRSLVNLDAAHGSIFAAAPTPAIDRERLALALFEAERPGDWPTWEDYVGAFGSPGVAPWTRKADRILAALSPAPREEMAP